MRALTDIEREAVEAQERQAEELAPYMLQRLTKVQRELELLADHLPVPLDVFFALEHLGNATDWLTSEVNR